MRYYCESYPDSVNHASPSILMLDTEMQKEENRPPQTILDLGCGNGRNSLYLADKYDATNVVLVDCDPSMLDWAKQLFSIKNIPAKTIHATIETHASDPREFNKKTGIPKFDVVIFSYVIQHIDPVYYPIILDFCRQVSSGHVAIDAFWNPSRLRVGEFTKIGSVSWYGLTYEELVTLIAPRFNIMDNRFVKTDVAVRISMALTEGCTPLSSVLKRNIEYYSGRIRHCGSYSHRTTCQMVRRINIDELECTKLLSSLYPSEFDFVRTEITEWIRNSEMVSVPFMAAKFLWLCRMNKIPVMLNEVTKDFGISKKKIIETMSETEYILPLTAIDYIDRLSKQLNLPDLVGKQAKNLIQNGNGRGTSPTIIAACAVIEAAEVIGFRIMKGTVASTLDVSVAGVRMALRKEGRIFS